MGSSGLASVTYTIDEQDRITSVGDTWVGFARANAAPELTVAHVVGREIWDFVADMETIHLYEVMIEKTRTTDNVLTVPFRCDAPALRRHMELRISSHQGTTRFESRLIRAEPRDEMPILDAGLERSDELQKICCWCKRMLVADHWVEVEAGIKRLGLFHLARLPMLTHAICQDCRTAQTQSLNATL